MTGAEGTRTLRLDIERLAYGADAIAHDETGKAVFVAGGVPGDTVEAELTSLGRSFDRARVVRVLEGSDDRVRASCPHANVCGGCPWAMVDRGAQLAAKRASLSDALVRIGQLDGEFVDSLVDACMDPGPALSYRNKVELGVARQHGRTVVGMHATDAASIVKVDACPLLDAHDPKLVKAISGAVTYLSNSHDLDLMRVAIRSSSRTGDLEVALWSRPGAFPRSQAAKVIADATRGRVTSVVRVLTKGPAGARRVTGVERLSGKGFWEERIGRETMRLSAPSFFQVNTAGAERLVELVCAGLSPTEHDEVMDLYCGAGTFTLPLARAAGFVSAVESYGPAVRDLRRNLELARIDNVDPIGGDAGHEFPDTDADLVVVDPPRAGLSEEVVERLSEQPARMIAYVSCDPATLARDLRRFGEAGSFRPTRITPVDLFPQTYHVESVVLMSREP